MLFHFFNIMDVIKCVLVIFSVVCYVIFSACNDACEIWSVAFKRNAMLTNQVKTT